MTGPVTWGTTCPQTRTRVPPTKLVGFFLTWHCGWSRRPRGWDLGSSQAAEWTERLGRGRSDGQWSVTTSSSSVLCPKMARLWNQCHCPRSFHRSCSGHADPLGFRLLRISRTLSFPFGFSVGLRETRLLAGSLCSLPFGKPRDASQRSVSHLIWKVSSWKVWKSYQVVHHPFLSLSLPLSLPSPVPSSSPRLAIRTV